MKNLTEYTFDSLFERYPVLSCCREDIKKAFETLERTYRYNGKTLVCGNGGSAADCEHIVGELMKSFRMKRPLTASEKKEFDKVDGGAEMAEKLQRALPVISLVSQSGLITAFSNDVSPELIFAQQVFAYIRSEDTLIALSTSGNSTNVVNAAKAARASGSSVISITGDDGGALLPLATVSIRLPSSETYEVQELTLPVYHAICSMLESEFFE